MHVKKTSFIWPHQLHFSAAFFLCIYIYIHKYEIFWFNFQTKINKYAKKTPQMKQKAKQATFYANKKLESLEGSVLFYLFL